MPTAAPTSAHATATMRANRGRDTGPEVALRSALHRRGLRFRKNLRLDLSEGRRVRPDIVFPGLRLAVFVDGCFWHGCQKHRSLPTSNAMFWRKKIEGTTQRDTLQVTWLREANWTVRRVWEHDVPDRAEEVIVELIGRLRAQRNTG